MSRWRGLGLAVLWIGTFGLVATLWLQARRANPDIVYRGRNFYGVFTVFEHRKDEPRGHHYLLQHGRITHGLQLADPQLQSWPQLTTATKVGLAGSHGDGASKSADRDHWFGRGTIATYARSGDFLHFYEINPAVKELAARTFTYLKRCAGTWTITPGDARLSLELEPSQNFDLLAVDAFSSDAIPVHLLTREAFALYLFHLNTNGLMAVHVSNHFLDLEPVVLRQAAEFGLHAVVIDHDADPAQWWIYSSTWILLSRDDQVLPPRPSAQMPGRTSPPGRCPFGRTTTVAFSRLSDKKKNPADPCEAARSLGCLRNLSDQSTLILRGFTRSDFGRVRVNTPCSMRAETLAVSIAGSSSNTRRKPTSCDSRNNASPGRGSTWRLPVWSVRSLLA